MLAIFNDPNPLRTRVLLPALSAARVGLWIASRGRGCVSIRIDVVEDVPIPEATRLLPQAVWRERRTLADAAYDRGVAILGLNGVAHSLGAAAAESGGERTWTTADARRATASYALGLALVRALPASHTVCLRRRRHPVGAECL